MTLPGHALVSRKIINGLVSPSLQVQLFGVDLTLERVLTWTSAGTVDLDNSPPPTSLYEGNTLYQDQI
ncbi:dUTP diphosphatase [Trichophyton rubrum]|uniref:dUTP diphosphatase n=1 Tax=Trichophyton rubrum TaxID=5551 RepID=A0A178F548_TRIRU|nr:dUTP diphosphatase [Trichophyton rubrum]